MLKLDSAIRDSASASSSQCQTTARSFQQGGINAVRYKRLKAREQLVTRRAMPPLSSYTKIYMAYSARKMPPPRKQQSNKVIVHNTHLIEALTSSMEMTLEDHENQSHQRDEVNAAHQQHNSPFQSCDASLGQHTHYSRQRDNQGDKLYLDPSNWNENPQGTPTYASRPTATQGCVSPQSSQSAAHDISNAALWPQDHPCATAELDDAEPLCTHRSMSEASCNLNSGGDDEQPKCSSRSNTGAGAVKEPMKRGEATHSPEVSKASKGDRSVHRHHDDPSLCYSKKARRVEYRPYTLKDYKQIKREEYYQIKPGMEPDLQDPDLLAKRAVRDRVKDFSRNLHLINQRKLAQQPNAPPSEANQPSKRERALEFAKRIPRPKLQEQSHQQPAKERRCTPQGDSRERCINARSEASGSTSPRRDSSSRIRLLEADHESSRARVEELQRAFGMLGR